MPQMHGGAAGAGTTVIAVRCPTCATLEDKVVDSRTSEDGVSIRRRRQCLACGARFTTFERLEEQPLMVVKRSGDRVPFERAKIESGVAAAAKGRPLSSEQIAELALSLEDPGVERRGLVPRMECFHPQKVPRAILVTDSVHRVVGPGQLVEQ